MDKAKIQCQLALVSELTMATNGVPVLETLYDSPKRTATNAVNFLRCGCPGVQTSINAKSSAHDPGLNGFQYWLNCLALPDERFSIEKTSTTEDGNEIWLVTRHTD